MFDLSINLGNVLTIASFLVGGTAFAYTIRADSRVQAYKLEVIDAQMEDFKKEMTKLTEVVIQQAQQSTRLDNVEERQMSQGKRLDEAEKRLNLYADTPIYERREKRGN